MGAPCLHIPVLGITPAAPQLLLQWPCSIHEQTHTFLTTPPASTTLLFPTNPTCASSSPPDAALVHPRLLFPLSIGWWLSAGYAPSLSACGSVGVDGEAHRVALICPVIDRVDAGRGRDRGVHRVPAMGWGFRAQVCRLFSGDTLPSFRSSKGEMAAAFFLPEMDRWEILQATPTWPP